MGKRVGSRRCRVPALSDGVGVGISDHTSKNFTVKDPIEESKIIINNNNSVTSVR
jgi:hypothetical protein